MSLFQANLPDLQLGTTPTPMSGGGLANNPNLLQNLGYNVQDTGLINPTAQGNGLGFLGGLRQDIGAAWNGMGALDKVNTVAGVGMGLFNAYNSWNAARQQTKFMQGQLDMQKNIYKNNVKTTNMNMEDRQRRRVETSNGRAESVDSYMKRNRVG